MKKIIIPLLLAITFLMGIFFCYKENKKEDDLEKVTVADATITSWTLYK